MNEHTRPGRSIRDSRLLLVALLLAGIWAWERRDTAPPIVTAPEQDGEPAQTAESHPAGHLATAGVVPKSAGASRAPVARSDHLVLYTSTGSYAGDQVGELAPEIEAALAYVEERTAIRLARTINIMFDRRTAACGLDAVAYTHVRTLVVYVCPDTRGQRVVNVLAHELVHQLAHDHFGAPHLQADLLLSEGLATWGAGRYWLDGATDFRAFVAANYRGHLLPLDTAPHGDDSAARLNQLYYQWAAFVEWIMAEYGLDTFERLYAAGAGRAPGSAPYEAVLGLSLAEATTHWLHWIDHGSGA